MKQNNIKLNKIITYTTLDKIITNKRTTNETQQINNNKENDNK
jgi:hypothetical protein